MKNVLTTSFRDRGSFRRQTACAATIRGETEDFLWDGLALVKRGRKNLFGVKVMPDICKHIVRGLIGIVCSSFGLAGCYGSGSMNGESSMKFSSLDLSQDRYMYMGLHLQKAPQDVVPCTDVDLSTGHNAKENCWVSSRREGNTYNGYVKRYYSKQKQVPYRICVYHDFGSSSDDAIKRYVDELICYIKKKSDGGSDLREVPDGTGGKSTQWSWTYLSWEFSMRLRIDDSTGAHGLEISIVCPVYLKAAKEELDN